MEDMYSASVAPFQSCAQQLEQLLPRAQFAFLTPEGTIAWISFGATLAYEALNRARASLASGEPHARLIDANRRLAMFPVLNHDELVCALLASIEPHQGESLDHAVDRTWRRLRPALDRFGSQLARNRETVAAEARPETTDELAWLLKVSAELRGATNTPAAMSRLLSAAVERLNASFGALAIPEPQLNLSYNSRVIEDAGSAAAYRQAHPYLMSYMQRRCAPLIANRPPGTTNAPSPCKILSVPISSRGDRQIGAITFCKPVRLADFSRLELHLAQHVARLVESVLDSAHDAATGLLTRAALEHEAGVVIAAHAHDEPHTVIYADIDDLHVINETFGFDFGDQAIAIVSRLLRPPHLPANAVCGRVAGDRFVVLLPGRSEGEALSLTQSFQTEVSKLTVGLPSQRITLSVGCGIAAVPRTTLAFSKAMAAAELACRTAKELGRGRTEIYLDVDDSMMHRKGDILSIVRLRAALDKERLQMFAQKIVPLRSMQATSGIECLARLVAEDGTIIPPAEFLSAAARYQMLTAVDKWMIEHTLRALQPYTSMLFHGEIDVTLNISEQSLRDDGFLRFLEDRIASSELAPRLITFDISESAAARDLARSTAIMKRLRRLGCRVALDDFGTRPASLNHLQCLKPDQVKIDASLVRNVLASAATEAAIATIAQATAALRIDCVAKHVESQSLASKLRELGVGYAQGNCLHQAEPFAQLLAALLDEEHRQLDRLYREY